MVFRCVDQVQRLLRLIGMAQVQCAQQGEILAGALAERLGAFQPDIGVGHIAFGLVGAGNMSHDLRRAWLQFMGFQQGGQGLIDATLIIESQAEIDENLRMRTGQFEGAAIVKFSGGQIILFTKNNGQLQMSLRVFRPGDQGGAGGGFG